VAAIVEDGRHGRGGAVLAAPRVVRHGLKPHGSPPCPER
jgi:hypothetical protein